MGVRIGPFDPIMLIFNVINSLMQKGLITYEDSKKILRESLPSDMPEEEKNKVIDSIIVKNK